MQNQLPHVVTIPGRFAADHFDRFGPGRGKGSDGFILSRGRRWTVRLNEVALDDLRRDANRYANGFVDAAPAGLVLSARRTVEALSRQVGA